MTTRERTSISFAITGSGGAGVMTAGEILLLAASLDGYFGIQTRSVGPQIRGGEAASMLRLSTLPVDVHADAFDILFALDWRNYDRFAGEITLTGETLVIASEEARDIPPSVKQAAGDIRHLPLSEWLKASSGRVNMLAAGLLGAMTGLSPESLEKAITRHFASKGAEVAESAIRTMRDGYERAAGLKDAAARLAPAAPRESGRWIINGNQAAGLGALTAGVKFAAAYPITPATEILEWLSPALSGAGGMLIQAEDELASINMIIGSSFGGAPSLTATSGPGLALMSEGLGLAVAAEIPLVVINVQRGGPSTGIPTKSEQTDLDIALHGASGEAPRLVLAASSVADCLFTTAWAVHLAEALQCPAIMLSDQMLGQMKTITPQLALPELGAERLTRSACDGPYRRYALTDSGVSPMALPGARGCMYTADGLEHGENAIPSTRAEDHAAQLAKRLGKLTGYDYGGAWADIEGEGETAIITWGSTAGAAREAARRLRAAGTPVKIIVMRLLFPAQRRKLAAALKGVRTLVVAENSFSGQFARYLRAWHDLPASVALCAHAGPKPISAAEIIRAVQKAGAGRSGADGVMEEDVS